MFKIESNFPVPPKRSSRFLAQRSPLRQAVDDLELNQGLLAVPLAKLNKGSRSRISSCVQHANKSPVFTDGKRKFVTRTNDEGLWIVRVQ